MQEPYRQFIQTNKYSLDISFTVDINKIEVLFHAKTNNMPPVTWNLTLPEELMENGMQVYRKIRRYRCVRINFTSPSVTLLLEEGDKELFFKNPIQQLVEEAKEYAKAKVEGEEEKQEK